MKGKVNLRFLECFTIDLYARNKEKYSFFTLVTKFFFNSGYRVVVYYRLAIYLKNFKFLNFLTIIFGKLLLVRLSRVPGVEFRLKKEIGKGILFPHPHDIVLGEGSLIGENVTIFNGVTLGAKIAQELDDNKDIETRYPVIEDNVTIYTGAKVIGPVTIGKNSIIGANSVVNKSYPSDSVIGGIPARLIRQKG